MKTILVYLCIASLFGCASPDNLQERVYAPQIVTGWKDANGKIHLKGVGGEQGFAVISEPRQNWPALDWGGASR